MTEVYGNRYEVLERVGDGGMATVYRGRDRVLKRDVAIKVMHPHLGNKPDARARFNREAQAIAKLHHGNIVDVYDFSAGDDNAAFLVTEFVHGETLTEFTNDHGPFLPQAAALVGHAIAGALGHAHHMGLIHRDIKPDNLMISRDGQLKLMDFGIAQAMDMEQMTTTGAIVGSPAHMAPEQIEGSPLDGRCDIFALGTVLYFLVTRRLPFVASNPQALFRLILEGEFELPSRHNPAVDRHFDDIIAQCLARWPADRYADMNAVQAALSNYLKTYRMSDATGLLTRFLKAPEVFQFDLKPTVVQVLTAEGQKQATAGKLAMAIDTLNRALAIDPDADEPRKALQEWTTRARRTRKLKRAGTVAGMATGALVVLAGLWFVTHLPDEPPPAAEPKPLPAEGALLNLPNGPAQIRSKPDMPPMPPPAPITVASAETPEAKPHETTEPVRKHVPGLRMPRVPEIVPKVTPVVTPPQEAKVQFEWKIGAIPANSTLYLDNQTAAIGEGFAKVMLDAGSRHVVRCEPGPKCEGCKTTTVRFSVPEHPTPGKMTKCDVRPGETLRPETP